MRANRTLLSVLSAVALATIAVPVGGTVPAEAQVQTHHRVHSHAGPRKPSARRHHVPRRHRAAPPYQAAPGGYVPVPMGAPVNGAPFGYSGCYGSRVQVYVPGRGLVWRPQVDCPYQDTP